MNEASRLSAERKCTPGIEKFQERRTLVRGIAEALRILLQEGRTCLPDWFMEEIGIIGGEHRHWVLPPEEGLRLLLLTL
ncbi:MAG: hypothetical protein NTNFB02_29350 [Nitrospira sp.]